MRARSASTRRCRWRKFSGQLSAHALPRREVSLELGSFGWRGLFIESRAGQRVIKVVLDARDESRAERQQNRGLACELLGLREVPAQIALHREQQEPIRFERLVAASADRLRALLLVLDIPAERVAIRSLATQPSDESDPRLEERDVRENADSLAQTKR